MSSRPGPRCGSQSLDPGRTLTGDRWAYFFSNIERPALSLPRRLILSLKSPELSCTPFIHATMFSAYLGPALALLLSSAAAFPGFLEDRSACKDDKCYCVVRASLLFKKYIQLMQL